MGSQFYVTLPSNSSLSYFPDNKTCRYTTKLHNALALNEDYEVGLAEIQFQNTWYNVREDNNWLVFYTFGEIVDEAVPLSYRVNIPTGYYFTGEELCEMINTVLPDNIREKAGFFYKKRSRRCYIEMRERMEIAISCNLAWILGFEGECRITESTDSPLPVDVHMNFHTFYVYSDIVKFQHVGDATVPLLRTIAVKPNKRHENMVNTFVAPHYIPLKIFNFETIDIILTTETGEVVPFERGKVIVKLHFRERSSSLP